MLQDSSLSSAGYTTRSSASSSSSTASPQQEDEDLAKGRYASAAEDRNLWFLHQPVFIHALINLKHQLPLLGNPSFPPHLFTPEISVLTLPTLCPTILTILALRICKYRYSNEKLYYKRVKTTVNIFYFFTAIELSLQEAEAGKVLNNTYYIGNSLKLCLTQLQLSVYFPNCSVLNLVDFSSLIFQVSENCSSSKTNQLINTSRLATTVCTLSLLLYAKYF